MTYSEDDIILRLDLGEDSSWGFKQIAFSGDRPKSPSRSDLADEIAAFANARGGVLLCGVTDDRQIQGMSRRQLANLDSLLAEACSDSLKPALRIRTSHMLVRGRRLLLVGISRGEALHDSPGGSYIRVGSLKRRMTSEERRRLARRRAQSRSRSYDEQVVPNTGYGTLDRALWLPLLSSQGLASPRTALEQLGLLAVDDAGVLRATVAGVLLCARNPREWLPNACIMATRYDGLDRASPQID